MGKPATTYFCRNGHLADAGGHGCFCEFDNTDNEDFVCPICGIKGWDNIKCITEWDDPDYWDNGNIDGIVPHKPVKQEDLECKESELEVEDDI